MTFEAAVRYLLGLGHETLAMKLGLRNTALLLDALDHPEHSFTSVQIAGTNGKGSTAAMLDSICRTAGIKCGLYTSPHLVSITERIKVSGTEITPEEFAACASTVRDVSLQLVNDKQIEALPTFFEQLTVLALLAFRNSGIELAILETGLGGRLDSTTAANASLVGITQIAMDHEEYLGSTLSDIAAEKAAIIRPGVKAVIAAQEPDALAVLLRRCDEVGVTPIVLDNPAEIETITSDGQFFISFKSEPHNYLCVLLGLRGQHQIENAMVALRLAELLRDEGLNIEHDDIVTGLETVSHPGRLELIAHKPAFLIDGAHNPAGAESLRDYLDQFAPQPLTIVFGAMRDKQLDRIAEILFPAARVLVLTTIQNPRSATIETLKPIARQFSKGTIITTESSVEALHRAITNTPAGGTICIAGSLYLAGELRPLLLNLS
jgi:dihydrofolate synthase / folylpolyglutamate synthase